MGGASVTDVIHELAQGWGVEDIAVRRGIPPAFTRKVIANLKRSRSLHAVLGVPK